MLTLVLHTTISTIILSWAYNRRYVKTKKRLTKRSQKQQPHQRRSAHLQIAHFMQICSES